MLQRHAIEATKRKAMTPARKQRIWEAYGGLCANKACRRPVPASGPGVTYDHDLPIWFGARPDTDEECGPLCDPCNKLKTALDQGRIAKTKRQQKMAAKTAKGTLRSQPFPKGPKQKIQSRGFAKTKSRPFTTKKRPRA